ncbi:F-box only protein 9 [Leucoagaricus sp. SymC.cos]|nr:F-box only protein 9 [Leucoagaricus sp. SymC.cos]
MGTGTGTEKAKAAPSQDEESSELARFRAEWRAELENRKRAPQAEAEIASQAANVGTSSSAPSTSPSPSVKPAATNVFPTFRPSEPKATLGRLHPAVTQDGEVVEQKRSNKLNGALDAYKQAVAHEQAGNLDEALTLYRQAFRMDAHVDRAYRREEMLLSIASQQTGKKVPTVSVPHTTLPTATESFQTLSIKPQALKTGQAVITGVLGKVVASFLAQEPTLTFKPEDETQPVALTVLPEEVLVEIIHLLDPSSIERFAQVCKKSRVLTLESSIWRSLVVSTYREPQIPDMKDLAEVITRHMFDYRRVFIEQPRVRTDGVYIAICHYIRPGLSENQWVNISHLITYHRYLRFYPNGQVLSLLANEEHPPQTIINMLKPSLRMKGLYIGTWSLSGTAIVLSNLFDASGQYSILGLEEEPPPNHQHHHHHGHHSHSGSSGERRPSRYVFQMGLDLTSRPLGRWNRLDIDSYDTLNLETGDVTPIILKHERPFWFSKVRSYA